MLHRSKSAVEATRTPAASSDLGPSHRPATSAPGRARVRQPRQPSARKEKKVPVSMPLSFEMSILTFAADLPAPHSGRKVSLLVFMCMRVCRGVRRVGWWARERAREGTVAHLGVDDLYVLRARSRAMFVCVCVGVSCSMAPSSPFLRARLLVQRRPQTWAAASRARSRRTAQ